MSKTSARAPDKQAAAEDAAVIERPEGTADGSAAVAAAPQEQVPPQQQQQQAVKKGRRSSAKKRRREEQRASRPQLKRVRVESFPVGSVLMNELMIGVMAEVRQQEVLRTKLFQVR